MRFLPAPSLAVLLACAAIASAAPASGEPGHVPPAPAGASMAGIPDTVQANADGRWPVTLRIVNGSEFGLYCDSVLVTVETTDAGGHPVTSKPRQLPLGGSTTSITGHDSLSLEVALPAEAEQATLVFRLFAHDHEGHATSLVDTVRANGSVLSTLYPSETIRVRGRDVEIVRVPSSLGNPPAPGILVLPAEGTGARSMLANAVRLSRLGYTLVVVSPTGGGLSTGPDDFAGPMSIAAAAAALDSLARMPGVDARRLGAWGISNGGTVALLLAADRPELRAVAAQSAGYDTWATYRFADPDRRRAILAEAGRDSAGWRARSPLARAASLKASTLVLHGETDSLMPVRPARAMVALLNERSVPADSVFLPKAAHEIPPLEALRDVVRFFNRRLGVAH